MISSDQRPPGEDWLVRRVTELERQVRELLAGRRLERATIGAGGLTIKDGGKLTIEGGGAVEVLDGGDLVTQGGGIRLKRENGTEQIYMGPVFYSGVQAGVGWLWSRYNGNVAFSLEGTNPDDQFLAFRDEAGNIVFSDDAAAGQGLATPYIPGQFVSLSVPTDINTTGTFQPLQMALWRKQHPRIQVWGLVNVTATTAEVRFRINTGPDAGTVIGGPVVVNNGFWRLTFGPFAVPGAHLSEFELEVQARVASGAGEVGVRVGAAIGMQS